MPAALVASPLLTRPDLFARLEKGHAEQVTVVTPNRRLAQDLQREFDAHQIAKGLTVWEAPDILPFGAFVERLWEDALYSDLGEKLPLLLTPGQEQHIWEEVLAKSGLLIVPQAAAQCREAWRLMHQWRVRPGSGNDDLQAFAQWASAYAQRTAGEVDAASLPDLMAQHLLKKPKLLVAYGFDVMPPQTAEFLSKFEHAFCVPEPVDGQCMRTSYPSAKHEIEAAAKWARARLEEGKTRIGVVVPDLGKRRAEVQRVFSRVMQPGYNLPAQAVIPAKAPFPFNVSLGKPLHSYPLVGAALNVIELALRGVDFAVASHVIRSPFLAHADVELSRRATLDAKLRKSFGETVSLAKLIAAAQPAPLLRKTLERVFEITKTRPDSPAEWARHFSALLEAAGFPGERPLDSDEFQTRAKWHETLGELAKLERISREEPVETAFRRLEHLCRETLFQPDSASAPIQVLGVLESAGLRFDCLWVTGLTDEAWPLDAHPNPFIPIALQKKAGIPQAAAETSAALDRRLTEEWLGAAQEVVVSFPAKEKDRDLAPSPLIAAIPEDTVERL